MKKFGIAVLTLFAASAAVQAGTIDFDRGGADLAGLISAAPLPPPPALAAGRTSAQARSFAELTWPAAARGRAAENAPAELTNEQMIAEFGFITSKLESVYSHLQNKQKIYSFSFDAMKEQYLGYIKAAGSMKEYRTIVSGFLMSFNDAHLDVSFPGAGHGGWNQNPPPAVTNTLTEDGILITRIARLSNSQKEQIESALAESARLARTAKGLVVDLRGNPGGNERFTRTYIANLIAHPIPAGTVSIRISEEAHLNYGPGKFDEDPTRPGFTPWYSDQVKPATDQTIKGPITVLIDGGCVSSCEGTALVFKFSGEARLFGAHTYGSSGFPVSLELPYSKASIRIPTWIQVMPDGTPIEDHGIYPDVEMQDPAGALEAALAYIRGK